MAKSVWPDHVLIPVWAAQILASLLQIVLSAVGNDYSGIRTGSVTIAVLVGIFAVMALPLILTVVQFILLVRHRLGPITNIVFESIKTLFWTAIFVYAVYYLSKTLVEVLFIVALLVAVILFLLQLGLLIYGAVIMHRYRKGTLDRGQDSGAGAAGVAEISAA